MEIWCYSYVVQLCRVCAVSSRDGHAGLLQFLWSTGGCSAGSHDVLATPAGV